MKKSQHAQQRQQQRAIPNAAIDIAVRYGLEIRQKGHRTAYFIGRRQVEAAQLAGEDISAFEGIAIIVSSDETLVTATKTRSTRILKRRAK